MDEAPKPPLTPWRQATLDHETLALVLLLVREHHEQTGAWLTVAALRALLLKPS